MTKTVLTENLQNICILLRQSKGKQIAPHREPSPHEARKFLMQLYHTPMIKALSYLVSRRYLLVYESRLFRFLFSC